MVLCCFFLSFVKGLPVPVAHTPCLPNRHGQTTRVRSLPGPFGLVWSVS